MSPRRRTPLPSFGPRRVHADLSAGRVRVDNDFPCAERPLPVELMKLERFSALMAAQGWPAHVCRLAYDRIYAGERFGFAKRVGRGELPRLARELLCDWQASRLPHAGTCSGAA